jgi:hypothetical protein
MVDSSANILEEVKRYNNIDSEVTEFDSDICSLVNGAFFSLNQLGVGPEKPFTIDEDTVFEDFTTQVPADVILNYLSLKTKLVFDPPINSAAIDAFKDRIKELEFRMNIMVDSGGGDISG